MNVVAKKALVAFWITHPQAKAPLAAWYKVATSSTWTSPNDIRAQFGAADFVRDNRVVFDIKGNDYRLVVHVSYEFKWVMVKFVGTHAEYDKIDAATVKLT